MTCVEIAGDVDVRALIEKPNAGFPPASETAQERQCEPRSSLPFSEGLRSEPLVCRNLPTIGEAG